MKITKFLLLILCAALATACNDDDDEYTDTYFDIQYFTWEGSINAEWVVDANGDKFKFEIENGYMVFGNTTYTNAWVDTGETADFSLDGEVMGAVQAVEDVNHDQIVALVAPNGTFLDIVGDEDELFIKNTDIPAVLVVATTTNSMRANSKVPDSNIVHSLSSTQKNFAANSATSLPPPMPASNAFIQRSGEQRMGILTKKSQ